MSEPSCKRIRDILRDLDEVAPNVPLLALGQTIFWDEPMKAGLAMELAAIGSRRRLTAGVHDTDYFAKLPAGPVRPHQYRSLPHNDTSTRGLWSAAAEFSTLFGSETVITRDTLHAAGLRVSALEKARPNIMDDATEAWGWKGVVSLDDAPPITAETPLRGLFPVLRDTLDWAISEAQAAISGPDLAAVESQAQRLHEILCDEGDDQSQMLGGVYRKLLPRLYSFVAGQPIDLDATQTTELLTFNTETAGRPRFELLNLFVDHRTRAMAAAAYNQAIQGGSGQYDLPRFGTGAIPFDIIIPGKGRGTIRIGSRGVVFMTRHPQFLSLKRPLESVADLAALVEAKFGPNCVIVGKAVALIGMLAREFVFVFHEGASNYVRHSRRLHELLAEAGYPMTMHPILRIRYESWDALRAGSTWFRLPAPFQRAFGAEDVSGASIAGRWRAVGEEQDAFLRRLGELRRPVELIRYLDSELGGCWRNLAQEYEGLQRSMESVRDELDDLRQERIELYKRRANARRARVAAEIALGRHWRERIFEKSPTDADHQERERLQSEVDAAISSLREVAQHRIELRRRQNEVVGSEEIRAIHTRRREIELEAELRRMRLIRDAVISSRGLRSASYRPSAWWFPVASPDGAWFRETIRTASAYLEPL